MLETVIKIKPAHNFDCYLCYLAQLCNKNILFFPKKIIMLILYVYKINQN